jgi:hypothetical protein
MVTLSETVDVYKLPNGSSLSCQIPYPFEEIDLGQLVFEIKRFLIS